MASKQSPAKVTLAMMKGKPIATSVPSIRYHASDDELEELYPSSEDEKDPESGKNSPLSSPSKSAKDDASNEVFEKRSSSVDGSLSEGTPPADPWKLFLDFRGKLTKTLEEKLSEIKSEKAAKRKRGSREHSSVSDSEDPGDVTPTEDFVPEKQEKDSSPGGIRRRGHSSSRFGAFSIIRTGLKAKNSEDDSVESGVEAAELTEDTADDRVPRAPEIRQNCADPRADNAADSERPEHLFARLKRQLLYQLATMPLFLWLSYYILPLPEYLLGLFAGVFVVLTIQKAIGRVKEILTAPVARPEFDEHPVVPIVEIPAAEEHAVHERFEDWLNELPYDYDHENYHVARTNPVLFKLEGDSLRIMETRTRIPKRAVWNEPQHLPKFTKKRVYSLASATIQLLPDGLTRRRRWSKKYPICVTFGKEGVIENIDLHAVSDVEVSKIEGDNKDRATIFEMEELEKNEEVEEDVDDTDEDDISQSRETTKDVFADCRDDEEEVEDDKGKLKIYVFARTDRRKEDWYRRLVRATKISSKRNSVSSTKDMTPSSSSPSLAPVVTGDSKNANATAIAPEITSELSYNSYMSRYTDTQSTASTEIGGSLVDNDVVWLNALLGRILFDMHKSPEAINLIQDKIQRKLSNIKLPHYMQSLLVTELVIGQGAPVIHKASKPSMDEHGLSIDLDITYEGCLTMTIETKLNLMKLTRAGSVTGNTSDLVSAEKPKPARSPMFDSDVEDSPETSTEEEDNTSIPSNSGSRESTPTQSSGRKFLSMVDKLAANRYFQHAAELSYVRRAMEGLSNTEIRLMVNVSSIEGCLTVNIPPPPSDRIWYGFKPVPRIILTAKPAVGEMAVNIGYVTKWIETKLLKEFERVVVLPNMDDLLINLNPNYPFHEAQ